MERQADRGRDRQAEGETDRQRERQAEGEDREIKMDIESEKEGKRQGWQRERQRFLSCYLYSFVSMNRWNSQATAHCLTWVIFLKTLSA